MDRGPMGEGFEEQTKSPGLPRELRILLPSRDRIRSTCGLAAQTINLPMLSFMLNQEIYFENLRNTKGECETDFYPKGTILARPLLVSNNWFNYKGNCFNQ